MKAYIPPPLCQLLKLAIGTTFPATREDIIANCKSLSLNHSMVRFIQLFPEGENFPSSDMFVERCEELELAIENGSPVDINNGSLGA